MKKETVVDIISSLFIILFLYTGLMKLIDRLTFDTALHKSHLLYKVAPVLIWLVPIGELLIALCLILPKTRRLGLYGSFLLMSIFTLYVGDMIYFGSHLPCTCGGIIQYMNWHQHFYFNSCFTILALVGLWLDKKRRSQEINNFNCISYTS